jgi:transposase
MPNKTDANDAAILAELARTGFYRAVRVKSEAAQGMRALLKARDLVLRQRMDLDNTIRGLLTSTGVRLPKGPRRWTERVELAVESTSLWPWRCSRCCACARTWLARWPNSPGGCSWRSS